MSGRAVGRVYSWGDVPWQVVVQWAGRGPRNVLLESVWTGRRVVRPFRGLRRRPVWIVATSTVFHLSRVCAEARSRGWRAFPLDEAYDPGAGGVPFYRPCRSCARR